MKCTDILKFALKLGGYEKKPSREEKRMIKRANGKKKMFGWGVAMLAVLSGAYAALHFIGKANKDRDRLEFGDERIEDADSKKTYDEETFYEKNIKQALDSFLAFLGLVILSPVFGLISLAIIIDDPGPVLFSQKRVGKDKKFFKLYKFRSMKMCTPHDTPTHLLADPDQYITRVGKILRKTSLDELPQLYNIFVGDMCIVGPRPALWNQDDLVAERDIYAANDVTPGLTGWAQINGRDELEIPVKAKLDS